MDEEYRVFRRYLRQLNRDSFMRFCEITKMTEEEIRLLKLYYCDGKTEEYIADEIGMCLNAYHNARMNALNKMRNWLHLNLYRPETTSFNERVRMLNELLYKNNKSCG